MTTMRGINISGSFWFDVLLRVILAVIFVYVFFSYDHKKSGDVSVAPVKSCILEMSKFLCHTGSWKVQSHLPEKFIRMNYGCTEILLRNRMFQQLFYGYCILNASLLYFNCLA